MKRRLLYICATIILLSMGCSQVDAPVVSDQGSISLRFNLGTDSAGGPAALSSGSPALQRALAAADYAVVKVFRPGNDYQFEVADGETIPPPPATLEMSIAVIAENNKRVAVELYENSKLIYFGVNENVDVSKDQNTHVSIVATQYESGGMWHVPTIVAEGVDFEMRWSRVRPADWYRIQESPFPDFSVISWTGVSPDTFVVVAGGDLPRGDYYFRVAGVNPYSQSDWGPGHYVRVFGDPVVYAVTDPDGSPDDLAVEGIRGETQVTATLKGEDFDFPNTKVNVFGQPAQILSMPTRNEMVIQFDIPDGAFSGRVTVSNLLGTSVSDAKVYVLNIAYIAGPADSGYDETAASYKAMIDGYGAEILDSRVAIVPYDWLPFFNTLDMFDLIIVGWDTGIDPADWAGGDLGSAGLMRDAEAPVLGLGLGGSALFELLGLDIGLYSAESAVQSGAFVIDESDKLFSSPQFINVPPTNYLNLYATQADQLSVFADIFGLPAGVTPYAMRSQLASFFPLIEQKTSGGTNGKTYFLWGFYDPPGNLTVQGQQLTENVVAYLLEPGLSGVVVP